MKNQIQRAVDLFKTIAQEKRIALRMKLPEQDLIIMATESEMEKILNNLITNAIKYTPDRGDILVSLSSADGRAILSVRDTGIGIPAEDIDRVFEDFYRTLEAKKIDPYGRGIGLPFVKKVVEALGGTIDIKSQPREGTEFLVTFPLKSK